MGTRLPIVADWTCQQTGDCCQGPDLVLTREELAELQAARPEVRTVTSPMPEARFVMLHGSPCPYLGADKRCTVYEVRPYQCRRFMCLREPGEPFLTGGPMGCLNLSVRVQESRQARRDYARNQRKAQRWAVKHGWTT